MHLDECSIRRELKTPQYLIRRWGGKDSKGGGRGKGNGRSGKREKRD